MDSDQPMGWLYKKNRRTGGARLLRDWNGDIIATTQKRRVETGSLLGD